MDTKPLSFDEDFSIQGKWWLPNSKTELYGELIYKQGEDISLKLTGAFNGETDLMNGSLQKYESIYGIDSKGSSYTLINASGYTYGRADFFQTTLSIEYVLKSLWQKHFDLEKHKIKAANFTTNFFMAFLEGKYHLLEGPYLQNKVLQITLKETADLDILQFEPARLSFIFDYGYHTTGPLLNFHFNQDIHLKIDFGLTPKLRDVVNELKFVKDFFSFFSYTQVSFRTAYLALENENPGQLTDSFNLLFIERASNLGQISKVWDVLLPFSKYEDEIKSALRNWFLNREFITNGLNLYFDVSYYKIKQPVNAFLNMVFALETLHKIYHDQSRRLSLHERLMDLIKKSSIILSSYFVDDATFCRKIVSQRNYLAHNHGSPNSVISNDDYFYYIYSLKMLFEISFLKILGISESSLQSFVEKNRTYEYYKKNALN